MRLRTLVGMIIAVLVTALSLSAASWDGQHGAAAQDKSDPITGAWDATFELQGMKVPATLKLKLDGVLVTGTADSEHTGPGTLSKGSWADEKLSFTMDFATHESIVVTGRLEGGKLLGEFATEGMRGTWEAVKR